MDEVIAAVVADAARTLRYAAGQRPEAQLVRAVRDALERDGRVRLVDGQPVYPLPGWTRPPGGIDVVAELGDGRVAIELKVGKPDESPWDAIKLADAQAFDPRVRAGYLLSDAHWTPGTEGSLLFARRSLRITCRDLIARCPRAWAGTMVGGRGIRPRTSVGGLEVSWVAEAPLAQRHGRRLVAVRVRPDRDAPLERYDAEGFPVGYEPPAGLRERIRRADAQLARPAALGPPPADRTDPCHGYPWYARWTPQRIEAVLGAIGEDTAARACLRRRLGAERGWTEGGFDPYARGGDGPAR